MKSFFTNQQELKRIYLLGIKYGPSVMALTCCFKLFFDSIDNSSSNIYEDIVHFINLLLNYFVIGMFYITGKYFHYCWKHQSLCYVAAWGYLFYFFFLIIKPCEDIIGILALWYLIFTLVITISYKSL